MEASRTIGPIGLGQVAYPDSYSVCNPVRPIEVGILMR